MTLPHKDIVFPEVDLSDDAGDPEWAGEDFVEVPERNLYRWLCPPGLHASVWGYTKEEWEETAAAYEADPDSFYESWHYLNNHPVYWRFLAHDNGRPRNHTAYLEHGYAFGSDAINVHVAMVCVKCRHTVHEDEEGVPCDGTAKVTEVWLETGKWNLFPGTDHAGHTHWHDPDLDCGGETYEEAIVTLARLVWTNYGNDRRIADAEQTQ